MVVKVNAHKAKKLIKPINTTLNGTGTGETNTRAGIVTGFNTNDITTIFLVLTVIGLIISFLTYWKR